MTRKILLLSEDKSIIKFVEVSVLTLTKLNHQIDLIRTLDKNIDLAIIDFDSSDSIKYIELLRIIQSSKNKKILGLYSVEDIDRNEIFRAGCDSVMSKSEFVKAANNVLMF